MARGLSAARLMLAGCGLMLAAACDTMMTAPELPLGEPVAGYALGGDVDTIVVRLLDVAALQSAVLVGSDGSRQEAYSIEQTRSPSETTPYLGLAPATIGNGGFLGDPASASTLLPRMPGTPTETVTLVGQIRSTAYIRIADPVPYRQAWRDYKIELTIGIPPNSRKVTLAAPQPPS
jgi:hypothetical protein